MEERLEVWAKTLSKSQLKDLVIELTDMLIESEDINFYEHLKAPIWDGNGEHIDGTDRDEED